MTHQRLASLGFLALFASACGGGNGSSSNPYDADASPKAADQPAAISGAQPKLADQPATITDPQPPDDTEPPLRSPTPTTAGAGGGKSCEAVCARVTAAGCSIGTVSNCDSACQLIQSVACSDQLLAVADCAVKQGYCPDDIQQADNPQGAAVCQKQAQAYASCAAANDK